MVVKTEIRRMEQMGTELLRKTSETSSIFKMEREREGKIKSYFHF